MQRCVPSVPPMGAGAFTDLRAAAQSMVHPGRTVEPDEATQGVYDESYARYKATYDALKPLFQRI